MRFLLFLFACLFSLDASAAQFVPGDCTNVAGNDPRWAQLQNGSLKASGRYCVQVALARPALASAQPALKVSLLGAYQLYWNGRYLGSNGQPADDAASERPGVLGSLHPLLPPHEINDRNVLRISVSTHHANPRMQRLLHDVAIGDYAGMIRRPLLDSLPLVAACGVMLLMALYMAIAFLLDRARRAQLLFAFLCGAFALMLVTELWKELIGYTYDLHVVRLRAILVLSFAIAILLPCYYAMFYQRPVRPALLGGGAVVLAVAGFAIDSYDLGSLVMLLLGVVASLAIGIAAWRARQPYSGINLAALAVLACPVVLDPLTFADRSLYLMFPLLALGLLLTLSLEQRQHRRHALHAVRLENELLRRSLQPHFLMNSLTMVMEWIEQQPSKAVLFIEALADEFRQLNACADKKLIPLSEELALCRSHLAIMGYRKGRRYILDAPDSKLRIPPALLHTLIENAFSHNKLDADATFSLTQHHLPEGLMLRFDCPYDGGKLHQGGGMGLAYVRAHLEDTFGRRWTLRQEQVQHVWRTEITIPATEAGCAS
ncbi:MAG: histidine kinase [Pseudomonadota bacterium]